MCTFNGESFIEAQLKSISEQSCPNWILYISDDGSTDATMEVVRAFQMSHGPDRVQLFQGPRLGFAQNFLSLLSRREVSADYFAYCDQDDVWHPHKLERAARALAEQASGQAVLWCSATALIGEHGSYLGKTVVPRPDAGFPHALVENIASGNTMVFNVPARNLITALHSHDVPAHDWITYLAVTACGGRVITDPYPLVSYRQHSGNVIGVRHGLVALLDRIRGFDAGRFSGWMTQNLGAIEPLVRLMPVSNAYTYTKLCAARKGSLFVRVHRFAQSGAYRSTGLGQIMLWVAVLLNKL